MDVARVLVVWSLRGAGRRRGGAPAGFDPSNPDDPQYNWGPVDQVVGPARPRASSRSSTSPATSRSGAASSRRCGATATSPDPKQFAVVRQGRRAALRRPREALHRLERAEPRPTGCSRRTPAAAGTARPSAPQQYREIARSPSRRSRPATPARRSIGPRSPRRASRRRRVNRRTRPLAFLRSLGCVDAKLRKDRKTQRLQGLQADHARRHRLPPAQHDLRARTAATRTPTTRTSPTAPAC